MIEAEIGVRLPQAREAKSHRKLEEASKDPPLKPGREHSPASTSILDF